MSGASYPIRTVIDMTRIPQEAWPKFLAELPAMLAAVAPLVAIYDAARDAGQDIPNSAYMDMLANCEWIDDDKGEANIAVTVRDDDGGEVFHSATRFKIPGAEA